MGQSQTLYNDILEQIRKENEEITHKYFKDKKTITQLSEEYGKSSKRVWCVVKVYGKKLGYKFTGRNFAK